MPLDFDDEEVKTAISEAAQKLADEQYHKRFEEDTKGLLDNKNKILAEKKLLDDRISSIESKYNLEELDEQLALAKDAENAKLTAEERFAAQRKELMREFDSERTSLTEQVSNMDTTIKKYLIDNELNREITKMDGKSHLLTPVLKDMITVEADGDKYTTRIKDTSGNSRVNVKTGEYFTIAELVAEYKESEDFGVCFNASKASGGSSTGSKVVASKASDANLSRSTMSAIEKSDYITKHGQDKYLALAV